MPRAKTLRRLAVLAAMPLALWSGYWVASAYALERATVLASEQARRSGFMAEFEHPAVGGYPTRFAMNLADLTVSGESLLWYTGTVEVEADSHRPFDIALDVSHPHRIAGRFGDLHIDSSESRLTILFNPEWSLPLGELALDAADIIVEHPDNWQIDMERITSVLQRTREGKATYNAVASVENVAFEGLFDDQPPGFLTIPEISLEALMRFDRAWDRALFQGDPPVLMELLLNHAAFEFGSSTLTLQAHLHRNDTASFSGAATVEVQDWQNLFAFALETGFIDPQLEEFFLPMLVELASRDAPDTQLTLPIQIQDGTVSYGAFTLGVLPGIP